MGWEYRRESEEHKAHLCLALLRRLLDLQRCSERVFYFYFYFFNLKIRRALLAKELLKMDSDKLTSPTYPSIRITEYNGAQGSVTMSCPNNIIRPEGLGNNIRDTAVPEELTKASSCN